VLLQNVLSMSMASLGEGDMDDLEEAPLERQLIHLHVEVCRLVSRAVVGEGLMLPGLVLHEEPTDRQVLCVEEDYRELLGPVYEEDNTTMEVGFRMASPDIGSLFPRPVWNATDVLRLSYEDKAVYLDGFRMETEKPERAKEEYIRKRAL
jgi:hypothetical protein